jgi:hypothetical protein
MKIEQLYKDFNIDYAPEGSPNVGGGWIGVHCPFCAGGKDYHLGFNLDSSHFNCWRCGGHSIKETLIKLLNVDEKTARQLIRQYQGHDGKARVRLHRDKKPFKYPGTTGPLLPAHKQYLADRGFDPDRLESEWGLLGTGPVSRLGESDYRLRVIAPIMWGGEVVSFQGRDITDRQFAKYKACPQEYEKIHHKHILYGKQEAWGSTGLIVEGITDVWRFGSRAAGTFGIKYTRKQLRAIRDAFDRVFILYDPEPQAQAQAKKMKVELGGYMKNIEVVIVEIEQDPGSMSQENADYLIKQLTS